MSFDDDNGASSGFGRLAWYQFGRWSAESAQRSRQRAQHLRDRRAGRRPVEVDQSYIDGLAANRDQLWREAHHYHRQLQFANQEIDKANSLIRELSGDIETQNSTNTLLSESASTENRRRLETAAFYGGLDDCLRALLKASEDGKTHYPEYQELKAIVQQMRDAWSLHKTQLYTHDRLGPHIVDIMLALQH